MTDGARTFPRKTRRTATMRGVRNATSLRKRASYGMTIVEIDEQTFASTAAPAAEDGPNHRNFDESQ
jgi:hypothetical protein